MPSPKKFKQTLEESKLSQGIINDIYHGFEELKTKASKKIKFDFFKQAIEVMNLKLPKGKVKEILELNACCKSGVREKKSKEFALKNCNLNINEKIKIISSRPYLNMGSAELDDNMSLIINAVSYRSQDKFECVCPTISKIKKDYSMPLKYCYCCGGHFKYHYETMLDLKMKLIEIISSPHDTDGQKPCVFRFEFLSED